MKKYFFGSYFKLQSKQKTLSLIPSYSKVGKKYMAHLQIITHNNSYMLDFPFSSYEKGKGFNVRINDNIFNTNGIKLNIDNENLKISGDIKFNFINKLKKNIMGPFKYIPFLECVHSVHSISHSINGKIYLNGEEFNFDDSLCYIEGDRGRSFPNVYIWTEALFSDGSLMLSIADIPFGLFHFTGIIGFVNYNNKTIILGTYNRAKPIKVKSDEIIVKKGKYKLIIKILNYNSYSLKAPNMGQMDRIIKESAECKVRYIFMHKDDIIFDKVLDNASLEYEYRKDREFDRSK